MAVTIFFYKILELGASLKFLLVCYNVVLVSSKITLTFNFPCLHGGNARRPIMASRKSFFYR